VFLVEDQSVFRDVAKAVLERNAEFTVVGEAADGAEAIVKCGELSPSVVVMDVNMPGMGGLEAARRLAAESPDASVVLTSMTAEREYPRLAIEIGAAGFITKLALTAQALRETLNRATPGDSQAPLAA